MTGSGFARNQMKKRHCRPPSLKMIGSQGKWKMQFIFCKKATHITDQILN